MASRAAALALPRLRGDQWAIVQHPARIKVVAMGRRWGKTLLGMCLSLATASQGGRVAWVVPTYKNGRPLWRQVERIMAPLVKLKLASVSRSERTVEFVNGGFFGIYSADNEDSIRGEFFDLVILDEAARIAESAWTDAIQPTLADRNGSAFLISTPKGHNWFYREWLRGQGDSPEQGYKSFQAPSVENPIKSIQEAARRAFYLVPRRTYNQEWLAQFEEDSGTVFREVSKVSTAAAQAGPQAGHVYVFGIDWGRHNDYTVISVFDATTRQQVAIDRFNQIGWEVQRSRVGLMIAKWHPAVMVIETNSMGETNIEALRKELVTIKGIISQQHPSLPRIFGFTTSNSTKGRIIDSLALAMERRASGLDGGVELLHHVQQIAELQAYEQERLPGGMFRYNAPSGMHDDTVMAAAMGWYGISLAQRHTGFSLIDIEPQDGEASELERETAAQDDLLPFESWDTWGQLGLGQDVLHVGKMLAEADPDNRWRD